MNKKGVGIITKLATIRKARGITQEVLSLLSGISRVSISRIEDGKTSPTMRTLTRLARALKVPVSDLIEKAG